MFACVLALVFAIVYVLVGYQLRTSLQGQVASEWAELQSDWRNGGYDALARSIAQRTEGARDGNTLLSLQRRDGQLLAGNSSILEPFDDRMQLRRSQLHVPTESTDTDATDTFYLEGGRLGDYFAAIGHSDHNVSEVQEVLVTAFAIGLLATTLLTLGTGYLLSQRAHARVRAVRSALERVARGDLNRIVPGSELNDDIGEIVRLINSTVSDLRIVMDSVQQISNDIAHDLKRPLGRLQRQLALAANDTDETSQSRQHLALAQQQAKSVQNVLEALLRIAQIESGARRSRFGPVDVSALLRYLHETFEPVACESDHRLVLRGTDAPKMIRGDEELLMQLLINLVENGICHTPPGSQIALSAAKTDAGVVVTVSDDGPGIRDEDLGRLTQRFYRCDLSRTGEDSGLGLGLSLVAAVASLHDARLEFEGNRPGLLVRVIFPVNARSGHTEGRVGSTEREPRRHAR